MSVELAGIIPPVITPFDENENYSPGAMKEVLDYLIDHGVHGIPAVAPAPVVAAADDDAQGCLACRFPAEIHTVADVRVVRGHDGE